MRLLLTFLLYLFISAQAQDDIEKVEEGKDLEGFDAAVFSEEDLASLDAGADKHEFEAEVSRLMEIIIHSLYTDRSIFMRELISNAGDALDKLRYKSLTNKEELGDKAELDIRVKVNKEERTISITDSGVGMTAAELTENLGTVAKSGTAKFLEAFASGKDSGDALNLIGQFGVGFYSAFLVADEVIVVSKSNDDDTQNIWRSTADGSFVVGKDPRGNTLGRGTSVILKMKEDADEFLNKGEIERLITRYSQFTQYPLMIWDSKVETEQVPIEAEEEAADEEDEEDDDELTAEDDDDEDEEEEKMKTIEKTIWFWKRLNENKPIWTRSAKDVTEEEYQSFYKSFAKTGDEALAYSHFKAEGEIEFQSIIYIPKTAPFGMYDNYYTSKSSLQLYVRRVLVADEIEDLVPRYFNFLKGMVDSNDLPLNVNREQLQKNKVMKVISKKLTRKGLDLLRKMAEAEEGSDDDDDEDEFEDDEEEEEEEEKAEEEKPMKYSAFWKEFGKSVKLGVIEDSKNRKKLLNLLRFPSTASDEPVSLQSYVDRMKDGQENIYFISAGSLEEAKDSPFLEQVTKKGFEVLFFVDNLDEYMNLNEFDDFALQAITKEGLDLNEGRAAKKYMEDKEEEFEDLTEWLKDVYGDKITKVALSNRLEETPMIIVTTKYGYSANMERIARGQAFGSKNPTKASKILEVNFRHPVIVALKDKVEKDSDAAKDLAQLLFDSALLQSGFIIEADAINAFASRVDRIARQGLGVEEDAEIEPLPEFPEDDDDEDDDDDDDEDDEDDEDLDDEDDEDMDKDEL
jgi:heat shock protein beta